MRNFKEFKKLSRQEKMHDIEMFCEYLKSDWELDDDFEGDQVELENIKQDLIYCDSHKDFINHLIRLIDYYESYKKDDEFEHNEDAYINKEIVHIVHK